jgi:peptide/nickel transport system substrate-binding protein
MGPKSVRHGLRVSLLAALALATSVTIAACGGSDKSGDGGTSAAGGGGGKSGGEVTIAQSSQPDYLDPALTFTVNGTEPLMTVYTPLLTYPHVEGAAGSKLIPGLAKALPTISKDGKTYTFMLREGLKYSDGQPVVASDFEHTMQRVFNLESPGASFYEDIVGAKAYEKAGKAEADIPGIETNDKTGKITIKLEKSNGAFDYILAMWFASLVPGDTPFKNMTKNPPPGVGPYKVTESIPNREFVLEKNPVFATLHLPSIPVGSLDKITTKIVPNLSQETQDVLDGKLDYMQDPPPADLKPTVKAQAADRFKDDYLTPSTYYFFLNGRVAPFDDPLVREAVNYAVDKPALASRFAGALSPGCSFIPPGYVGYDASLDTTGCPYGDPTQPPDVAKAKALVKQAGAVGAAVTVWGKNEDPTAKVVEAYASMLNEIGLKATPKLVDPGVYYQTIGNAKTGAQTGAASGGSDFLHPIDMYFAVDGGAIQPTNNQNFGNIDDEHVNSEIARLTAAPDAEAVASDWVALDRYLVGPPHSYLIPYGHGRATKFLSDRLDFDAAVFHSVYFNDYSTWRLK